MRFLSQVNTSSHLLISTRLDYLLSLCGLKGNRGGERNESISSFCEEAILRQGLAYNRQDDQIVFTCPH